jgi:hypothetical protein
MLGLGKYPPTLGEIIAGLPQVRAITGGTGRAAWRKG